MRFAYSLLCASAAMSACASEPQSSLVFATTSSLVVATSSVQAELDAADSQLTSPTIGSTAVVRPPATVAATSSSTTPPTIATSQQATTTTSRLPPEDVLIDGLAFAPRLRVVLQFESRIVDVSTEDFARIALSVLRDERGWIRGDIEFVEGTATQLRVILAEGPVVDALCVPLRTRSTVSCQNGTTVAINADRWRSATDSWDGPVDTYREYLINHELGHLVGLRHPTPRCPVFGAAAAVMEQQTGGLEGCVGNGWPRPWEIDYARARPAMIAPLPDWGPDPVPRNREAD